jgi:amidohydrolase
VATPTRTLSSADTQEVIALRRRIHAHPELGYHELATTALIVETLQRIGLRPTVLPGGSGVLCDIGAAPASDGAAVNAAVGSSTKPAVIALRADIDALPLADTKQVTYRSRVDGACHACGHDAHTAILLGAAKQLAVLELPSPVRLIFQPAEETLPGGALSVIDAGGLDDVAQIFALHCDPRLPTGQIGLRVGAITAACDHLEVRLSGPGGHTARPQLTVDLVYALGVVITELPALLSRRVDPRAVMSLVWGSVAAGRAANTIPSQGSARATIRVADRPAWDGAEKLVRELVNQVVAPTGAEVDLTYQRGVPPVINDAGAVARQRVAVGAALGPEAAVSTEQSMGGEDFAWYLDQVPGALARLGVARADLEPGAARLDLHRGDFDIDEGALAIGVSYTVELALAAGQELRLS